MTGAIMHGLPLVAAAALLAAAQILATDAARAEGDAARGQMLYADCVVCHSVERGVHGIGPSLYDIIGRRAGEVAEYRYSRALRNSGLTWTAEALDTFIGDPQATVPANRMPYSGMTDAGERADLIAYLRKLSK